MANIPYPPISTPTQMGMNALDLATYTQTLNQNVMGTIASLGPTFNTASTSAVTFLSANIPGGTLPVGTTIRFRAAGAAAAANTTTLTFNFGAFVGTVALVNAGAGGWWGEIDVVISGVATESFVGFGVGNAAAVNTAPASNGTVNTAVAVACTFQLTVSASNSTVYMATVEVVR